jgi:hypothetical protein
VELFWYLLEEEEVQHLFQLLMELLLILIHQVQLQKLLVEELVEFKMVVEEKVDQEEEVEIQLEDLVLLDKEVMEDLD